MSSERGLPDLAGVVLAPGANRRPPTVSQQERRLEWALAVDLADRSSDPTTPVVRALLAYMAFNADHDGSFGVTDTDGRRSLYKIAGLPQ